MMQNWTPLMYACVKGSGQLVKALVRKRALVQLCNLDHADDTVGSYQKLLFITLGSLV